jgi:glycosyltransferase involved in cell wall biosynthesis
VSDQFPGVLRVWSFVTRFSFAQTDLTADNLAVSRAVIVIPCFNEELRLDVDEFRRFQLDLHRVEFLFVNDGSGDRTIEVLQRLATHDPARFSVLDLPKNGGKAEAVRQGTLTALATNPDFVGFWDADLATPLDELPGFLDLLETGPALHLVFGARVRLLGREISRQPARHYVGRIGATLISSSLGVAVYDTQCGAKLFRASEELRDVFARPFLSRWIFDVEILARFIERWGRNRTARATYELPLRRWHDVRGSKVRSGDFLKALNDLWRIRRAYRRRD